MRIQVSGLLMIQIPAQMRVQIPDHRIIQVPDHMRIQVPDHRIIQVPDHMRIQLVDEFQVLSAQILLSLELFLRHVLKINKICFILTGTVFSFRLEMYTIFYFISALKFLLKTYNNSQLKVVARTFVKSSPKLAKWTFCRNPPNICKNIFFPTHNSRHFLQIKLRPIKKNGKN
jgi:hypothetical protein